MKKTNNGSAMTEKVKQHGLGDHLPYATSAIYKDGRWSDVTIDLSRNVTVPISAHGVNYGGGIIEGMKIHRLESGDPAIFRLLDHHERFGNGCQRIGMPVIPFKLFRKAIMMHVSDSQEIVPVGAYDSLYVRPIMVSTNTTFNPSGGSEFVFSVLVAPMYYDHTYRMTAHVEMQQGRACDGGVGGTKTIGNYAAAAQADQFAKEQGYKSVLWTDAATHQLVEEFSTLNFFVVREANGRTDCIETPDLRSANTIIPGVTRRTVIAVAREAGFLVKEHPIAIDTLMKNIKNGNVREIFGTGTASAIIPFTTLRYQGEDYTLPNVSEQSVSQQLVEKLFETYRGKGKSDWVYKVPFHGNSFI